MRPKNDNDAQEVPQSQNMTTRGKVKKTMTNSTNITKLTTIIVKEPALYLSSHTTIAH